MNETIFTFLTIPTLVSLLTLTFLEIILGIDNIIFISIVAGRLPAPQQPSARGIGLSLALIFRILLLLSISWVASLVQPVFSVLDHHVSWRDLILISGGLFLIYKSTVEIHAKVGHEEHNLNKSKDVTFRGVVSQIIILDLIFSVDSIITAIGLAQQLPIMIGAVLLSLAVMLLFSASVSDFVNRNPTIKMLALCFLLMIGMVLVADGMHFHVPKGYVYFAMFFSLAVELLNSRMHKKMAASEVVNSNPSHTK